GGGLRGRAPVHGPTRSGGSRRGAVHSDLGTSAVEGQLTVANIKFTFPPDDDPIFTSGYVIGFPVRGAASASEPTQEELDEIHDSQDLPPGSEAEPEPLDEDAS